MSSSDLPIDPSQRYTPGSPCPLCGGNARAKRGDGTRCHGYRSSSGRGFYCSRVESGTPHDNGTLWWHPSPERLEENENRWTPSPDGNPWVDRYPYTDEKGACLFEVVRTSTKEFYQRRPDPLKKYGWAWNLENVRRVVYRLPELIRAVAERRVIYVVEGEKDVHAIERAGGIATCNPGGAGKWRPEFSSFFADAADVVVVADWDDPGRKHAHDVLARLQAVRANARVVRAAEGKDAADHLAGGKSLEDFVSVELSEFVMAEDATATFGTFEELVALRPPRQLVRGMIPEGTLGVLFGNSGVGKSFVALSLAVAIANRDQDWLALPIMEDPGPVIFVFAEGLAGAPQRVLAATKNLVVEGTDRLAQGFHFHPKVGDDPLDLVHVGTWSEFARKARGIRPSLVIVDTLHAAMISGSEMDERDIGAVCRHARTLCVDGTVVLLVHHTGHSNKDRHRGHSSLFAALDWEVRLDSAGPAENGNSIVQVISNKARDLPEFDSFHIELEPTDVDLRDPDSGQGLRSLRVKNARCPELIGTSQDKQTSVVLGVIDRHSNVGGASRADLLHAFPGKSKGTAERTASRLLNELFAGDYVAKTKGRRWEITDAGREHLSELRMRFPAV